MGFVKTKLCVLLLNILFIDTHWLFRVASWEIVLVVAMYFDGLLLSDLFGVYAWHGATIGVIAAVNIADAPLWVEFVIPVAFAVHKRQYRILLTAALRMPFGAVLIMWGFPAKLVGLAIYYSMTYTFYELYQ